MGGNDGFRPQVVVTTALDRSRKFFGGDGDYPVSRRGFRFVANRCAR